LSDLATRLIEVWDRQAADGYLLAVPSEVEVRAAPDPSAGIEFLFAWMAHRELRHDAAELAARRIIDPDHDPARLFCDPRDGGRHCFLCPDNIRIAQPGEVLIDLEFAGRRHVAGVNFAWSAPHHFTVISAEHEDQRYSERTLGVMLDIHRRSGFRVTYHGAGVGATIPHHLHYQITTQEFPIENLQSASHYPIPVGRFAEPEPAHRAAARWIDGDPVNHDVNLLVAGAIDSPQIYLFPRDRRRARAAAKGLIGGFEAAGYFIYSEPEMRPVFELATGLTARDVLAEVSPGAYWEGPPGSAWS